MIKPYSQVFLILLIFLLLRLHSTKMRYIKCRTPDFRLQTAPFNALYCQHHTQMTNGIYIYQFSITHYMATTISKHM